MWKRGENTFFGLGKYIWDHELLLCLTSLVSLGTSRLHWCHPVCLPTANKFPDLCLSLLRFNVLFFTFCMLFTIDESHKLCSIHYSDFKFYFDVFIIVILIFMLFNICNFLTFRILIIIFEYIVKILNYSIWLAYWDIIELILYGVCLVIIINIWMFKGCFCLLKEL